MSRHALLRLTATKRYAPQHVSPPYYRTTFISESPPFPFRPGISIPINHRFETLQMATNYYRAGKEQIQVKQIDVLPDDVLLGIFDFYTKVYPRYGSKREVEAWQSLVHVCRRWRSLVFRSPRRLNLRLYCTPKTPAKYTIDVWPAFPLLVRGDMTSGSTSGTDNIIAALEQRNRIREIILSDLADWQLEKVLAAMQAPFPELTDLRLFSYGETLSIIPDSFLDGSAPRLQKFDLEGIPFPGLSKLLSSAADHLVWLNLSGIPHSGYISPEAIVALISVLSSLETLHVGFRSPQSRPDWENRHLPPSKRFVIAALTSLHFVGVVEYLEDLVTGIDTPQLNGIYIHFFNQIDFHTPRLARFINRTPKLTKHGASVQFNDKFARVALPPRFNTLSTLMITIPCGEPDWQLSSTEQVCSSFLQPLSTVEDLCIEHQYLQLVWKDDAIENTLWLQLLLPFTAVKNLYVFKEFAPGIVAALQELGGGITGVLPSLQNIFVKELELSGPFQENVEQFVAARQLSDHPIAISDWDESSDIQPM